MELKDLAIFGAGSAIGAGVVHLWKSRDNNHNEEAEAHPQRQQNNHAVKRGIRRTDEGGVEFYTENENSRKNDDREYEKAPKGYEWVIKKGRPKLVKKEKGFGDL